MEPIIEELLVPFVGRKRPKPRKDRETYMKELARGMDIEEIVGLFLL